MAISSGTRTKKTSGEEKNGSAIIAGVIMGTLVGGSSTVGTAQLAYQFGMSAWWFTLGGGLACLILALFYTKPLRAKSNATLVGMIGQEYGPTPGMAASLLNTVGTFINIISQLLSASAVLLVVWPAMGTLWTVILSALFMALYVVFGGTRGAGIVGILKLLLLYVSMAACGVVVLICTDGLGGFLSMVEGFRQSTGVNYFSLFCRGVGTDLGSCLSLILGVLTTQTYAQAILSGKSDAVARRGGLISAFLIPPIGVCGILVGLYMRSVTDPAVFVEKTALTQFALTHLPPLLGGVVLGTLFIASVGTGAGLALGISSILSRDVICRFTRRFDEGKKREMLSKCLIVAVLAVGCCFSTGSLGDTILNFAFMSMGLRGAVVFVPLFCLLWLPGRLPSSFALAAIIAGPLAVLIHGMMLTNLLPFDSLFSGILVSLLIAGVGIWKDGHLKRSRKEHTHEKN